MNPTLSERLRRRERHHRHWLDEPSTFWVPAEPPTALAALMQCRAQAAVAVCQPQAPDRRPRRAVIVELLVWMLVVLIDGALAAVALMRPWTRRPATAGASADPRLGVCVFTARSAAVRLEMVP